jgi:predicted acetyltransferase
MCQMCDLTFFGLAEPQLPMLASYASALEQGWSPRSSVDVSAEQLATLRKDPQTFLAELNRQDGTFELETGEVVPKLPNRVRWMWDGEFCGTITLRWQAGTSILPPYVHGHIGYSVVPWKRGHGLAKRALRLILREAREVGLDRVEVTTEPENTPSQKVILANGGRFLNQFATKPDGTGPMLRYEILTPSIAA